MEKLCEICEFLKEPSSKNQHLETRFWRAGIGNNHAYFGRAFVTLKQHKGNLSSLTAEEWVEFQDIVTQLESAYASAFGAEPLNWGCFMNHAFRTEPFNPHVHWHVFPRYKVAPVFNGVSYEDSLFGSFYDSSLEKLVSDDTAEQIALELKRHITS